MSLLQQHFSALFEPALLEELETKAALISVEAGVLIMDIGQQIRFTPLVLSGAIKVSREDADRGELLLYYLAAGNMCTLSATCCMGDKHSEIRAVTEMPSTIAKVTIEDFTAWFSKYPSWRNFILNSYDLRLKEMLTAIDNLAFNNMDRRILSYLKDKVALNADRILTITHQQIATDLNTSRVVISRILKKLEQEDKIVLLRNEIRVLL